MRNIVLSNIGIGIVLLVVFTTTSLPGDTVFWNAMQNAGHGLAMCFAALTSISTTAWKAPQYTRKIFIIVPLALFALGTLIEAVQHFTGRGASAEDMALNSAGIVAGMCFSTIIIFRGRLWVKLFTLSLGILLITWCVRHPAYFLANKWLRPTPPIIAHFDEFAADARIQLSHTTYSIEHNQTIWPSSEGKSMMATFYPARWPYVRIVEMAQNWSNYSALALEVFNSQTNAIKLNIKVDYQTVTGSARASMIASQLLQPGHNSFTVPFTKFVVEPNMDEPNFAEIERLMFYVSSPKNSVTLYFDNIRLQ